MKWCNRSIVESPIDYGMCFTERDFMNTLKANGIKDYKLEKSGLSSQIGATVSFYIGIKGNRFAIVCLGIGWESHPTTYTNCVLVHEAVHIWQEIREMQGEDQPSPEYEAYSIESISFNLITQLEDWKSKIKTAV